MPDIVDLIRANVRHSRKLAKEILADPDTCVLDTETTGLNDAYICDIAVIARGATLLNTLVNPGFHIPSDASAIHGIYDRDVKDAPKFGDIWGDLEDILRGKRVVIYNSPYDLRIIANEWSRAGIDPFNVWAEDALALYQQWYFGGVGRSGRGQTKLTTAHCDSPKCIAAVQAHSSAGAHRAYSDCKATVARLRMIAETCWIDDHIRKAKTT